MAEQLVNKNDFELYKPIPPTLNFESFVPVILRVQRGWVRDAIGEALYYDVYTNPTTGSNPALISGGAYSYQGNTIAFYGLKPAIVLYAYASYIKHNDFKLTLSGNKKNTANASENQTLDGVMREYDSTLSEAQGYMREVLRYLEQNQSSFPLWKSDTKAIRGSIAVAVGTQYDVYSEDDNYLLGGNGTYRNYPRYE